MPVLQLSQPGYNNAPFMANQGIMREAEGSD
jgi:hypothetical protein